MSKYIIRSSLYNTRGLNPILHGYINVGRLKNWAMLRNLTAWP